MAALGGNDFNSKLRSIRDEASLINEAVQSGNAPETGKISEIHKKIENLVLFSDKISKETEDSIEAIKLELNTLKRLKANPILRKDCSKNLLTKINGLLGEALSPKRKQSSPLPAMSPHARKVPDLFLSIPDTATTGRATPTPKSGKHSPQHLEPIQKKSGEQNLSPKKSPHGTASPLNGRVSPQLTPLLQRVVNRTPPKIASPQNQATSVTTLSEMPIKIVLTPQNAKLNLRYGEEQTKKSEDQTKLSANQTRAVSASAATVFSFNNLDSIREDLTHIFSKMEEVSEGNGNPKLIEEGFKEILPLLKNSAKSDAFSESKMAMIRTKCKEIIDKLGAKEKLNQTQILLKALSQITVDLIDRNLGWAENRTQKEVTNIELKQMIHDHIKETVRSLMLSDDESKQMSAYLMTVFFQDKVLQKSIFQDMKTILDKKFENNLQNESETIREIRKAMEETIKSTSS